MTGSTTGLPAGLPTGRSAGPPVADLPAADLRGEDRAGAVAGTPVPVHSRSGWPTIKAIWLRESLLFRDHWLSVTFGALIEPLMYMIGFGLGFAPLVRSADGHPYLQFIGTGMVVTSALFAAAFAGMFETYTRRRYQKLYDAILAEPVGVRELVVAETSWYAVKAMVYGCAPLVVVLAIGLPPHPEILLVPVICLFAGAGFGLFGVWVSASVPTIDGLRLVVSGLLTPVMMAAGVFFPVAGMPAWLHGVNQLNPIYHCAELVRHAAFGELEGADWLHAGVILAFAVLMGALAIRSMRRRLIS
jgi:lipooligosaccharide transport system permease protein